MAPRFDTFFLEIKKLIVNLEAFSGGKHTKIGIGTGMKKKREEGKFAVKCLNFILLDQKNIHRQWGGFCLTPHP